MKENKAVNITIISALSVILLSIQVIPIHPQIGLRPVVENSISISSNVSTLQKAVKVEQYLGITNEKLKHLRRQGLTYKQIFEKYKKSYQRFAESKLSEINNKRRQKRQQIIEDVITNRIDFDIAELLLGKMKYDLTLADLPA